MVGWSRILFDGVCGIAFFLLDRVVKGFALSLLCFGTSVFIGTFHGIDLRWTLTLNEGAAWGLFHSVPGLLFAFRVLFISLLVGVYFCANMRPLSRTCLVFIIFGAFGNIVDTIFLGHVVDMIHVTLWGWEYPVFNVADIGICLGCIGLILVPVKSHYHGGKSVDSTGCERK